MAGYYPPVAFSFEVRIAGASGEVGCSFAEVSGLDAEREVKELIEGGETRFVHQLPRQIKHSNLVLKRGIMLAQSALFVWCKTSLESDLSRPIQTKSITVSLLDQSQKPQISWILESAYPVKWSVASFDATKSEVAMETLEFAYRTLTRKVEKTTAPTGMFTSDSD